MSVTIGLAGSATAASAADVAATHLPGTLAAPLDMPTTTDADTADPTATVAAPGSPTTETTTPAVPVITESLPTTTDPDAVDPDSAGPTTVEPAATTEVPVTTDPPATTEAPVPTSEPLSAAGFGELSLMSFDVGVMSTTNPSPGRWCDTAGFQVHTFETVNLGIGAVGGQRYPATITVSGESQAPAKVTVELRGIFHPALADIDALLVGPGGQNLIVMSDAGGNTFAQNLTLTFDDDAAGPIGVSPVSGTYTPTNVDDGSADSFPAPAPTPSSATTLAGFGGIDPNGIWTLYAIDDVEHGSSGYISGWCLNLIPPAPTTTTLVSSSNPSLPGAPVTFTATVSSSGSAVTTGSVTFRRGAIVLHDNAPLDGSGRATLSPSAMASGSHPITATYNPTSAFLTSSATVTQYVEHPTTNPSLGRWCNTGRIDIPDIGTAGPYPSTLTVAGADPTVDVLTVDLLGFTHSAPTDVDILLLGPGGQNLVVMSDTGGTTAVNGIDLTFDDNAAAHLGFPLTTGTFKPTNFDAGDFFPPPAPIPPSGATALEVFAGTDPNGAWRLFVVDDTPANLGAITGGWCLNFPTTTDTAVESSWNPSVAGDTVTFTATVASGGIPVAGSVTFTSGTSVLAADVGLNPAGTATYTTSALAAGDHPITATYNPQPGYATSRDVLTQTVFATGSPGIGRWCNTGQINIPASGTSGLADPYPSTIGVAGHSEPPAKVTVDLNGFFHGRSSDIDVMLVGPGGQNLILMSDAGGDTWLHTGTSLTFDDDAGPIGTLAPGSTGTYRPTNVDAGEADSFPDAPTPSGADELAVFAGVDPNGTWRLYIVDDVSGQSGSLAYGWCLNFFTATTTALTSSSNPSVLGAPITFTAEITTSGGSAVTTGSVTFTSGATVLHAGAPLDGNGRATFTTSALPAGSHPITATHNPTSAFLTSSATVTQYVEHPTTNPSLGRWCNTGRIDIPDIGTAGPYPSTLTVAGANPVIEVVTLDLLGLTHSAPTDVDILLLGPGGQNLVVMSDTGGTTAVNGIDLTFDDNAAAHLGTVLTTGAYKPTNFDAGDFFPPPAPIPPSGATALEVFAGTDPNGAWRLFVVDDTPANLGAITGGWCLNFPTTTVTTTGLASSLNPSTVGDPVTFTATVTTTGDVAVTDGTVTFRHGTTVLHADAPIDGDGRAMFTTAALPAGSHSITATYDPAPNHAGSNSDPLTQTVGIVADAGGPYVIDEGDSLALDASGSRAGPSAIYSWDVNGDGVFGDATGVAPTLTWAELGALGITDGDGTTTNLAVQITDSTVTDGDATSLTVDNVAPTATLSNDGPVPEGSTATVRFSDQFDPSADDLAALTYSYDLDDDGIFEIVDSPSPSAVVPAELLADGPSVHTVRAVVADDDGGSLELTTDIEVLNIAPTVTLDGPTAATVGEPAAFEIGANDDSPIDMDGMFGYSIDWGDGSPVVTLTGPADPTEPRLPWQPGGVGASRRIGAPPDAAIAHTYTAAGVYTIIATATDPDGDTSEPLRHLITVADPPPTTTVETTTVETTTVETTIVETTTSAVETTTTTTPRPIPTEPAGELPSTGSDAATTLRVGAVVVLAGLATVIAAGQLFRSRGRTAE